MPVDLFLFDGNGVLQGVAKTYHRVGGTDHTMPADEPGATLITGDGEVLGATVRTRQGVKPVFVSCGSWVTCRPPSHHEPGRTNQPPACPPCAPPTWTPTPTEQQHADIPARSDGATRRRRATFTTSSFPTRRASYGARLLSAHSHTGHASASK